MTFLQHRLDNGLEIIAEVSPEAYTAAYAFVVATGSRDETDAEAGLSHFLEHMAFKGTPRRSAEEVNRELDEIGSQANAFTSEEQTVYYLAVLPEYQQRAIDILADMMRPSLREDDFNTEKQVILEEIKKYDDEPPYGAYDRGKFLHFGNHPLGRSVLGTTESVSSLTPEQMRDYFRRRYSPGNMFVVAAGRVDFDRLVADVEKWCGGWEPVETSRETATPRTGTAFEVKKHEAAFQEYIIEMADSPSAKMPDRFAARVLATIVGDDSGSRFFWELIDTGRAEYAVMSSYEYLDAGLFLTYLCCRPEAAAENLQLLRQIEKKTQADGVTARELELAQSKICSHVVLKSERPINRLFSVGANWLQLREYWTVKQAIEAYRSVSLDDVHRVLEHFPLTRCTTVAVGPLDQLGGTTINTCRDVP